MGKPGWLPCWPLVVEGSYLLGSEAQTRLEAAEHGRGVSRPGGRAQRDTAYLQRAFCVALHLGKISLSTGALSPWPGGTVSHPYKPVLPHNCLRHKFVCLQR